MIPVFVLATNSIFCRFHTEPFDKDILKRLETKLIYLLIRVQVVAVNAVFILEEVFQNFSEKRVSQQERYEFILLYLFQ